jgi:hypothetical protein
LSKGNKPCRTGSLERHPVFECIEITVGTVMSDTVLHFLQGILGNAAQNKQDEEAAKIHAPNEDITLQWSRYAVPSSIQ